MDPIFTSPKRHSGFFMDPEKFSGSPPIKDITMYPWNWGAGAQRISLSPGGVSVCSSSPDNDAYKNRRGRPRADSISNLIVEGSKTPSDIRCEICKRTFPREKSLQAHLRTHTGERPYQCDFPGCGRAFCQSGQLKTHQRLHTGEKPFVCTVPGCQSRYTHANRHCAKHPMAVLKRELNDVANQTSESDPEVLEWLKRQFEQKQGSTPNKVPLNFRASGTKRSLTQDIENQWIAAKRKASQTTVTLEGMGPLSPIENHYVSKVTKSQLKKEQHAVEFSPLQTTVGFALQDSVVGNGTRHASIESSGKVMVVPERGDVIKDKHRMLLHSLNQPIASVNSQQGSRESESAHAHGTPHHDLEHDLNNFDRSPRVTVEYVPQIENATPQNDDRLLGALALMELALGQK